MEISERTLGRPQSFGSHFSKGLFWDINIETLDPVRNRKWLLERILERGRWEDWLLIQEKISAAELRSLAPRLRLTPKSCNFLNVWMEIAESC
jgi:hypothetical protein